MPVTVVASKSESLEVSQSGKNMPEAVTLWHNMSGDIKKNPSYGIKIADVFH